MTTTATSDNGWRIGPLETQLPAGAAQGLAAAATAGQGQAVFYQAGSANVALNDGQTPDLICAGVVSQKLAGPPAAAGSDKVLLHQGLGDGQRSSTLANDAFLAADVLAPAYDAGSGVPGKLAVYGGYKRSLLGLCLGLAADATPRIWAGPIASLLGRALGLLTSKVLGWYSHPVDGSAATTTAEKIINREPIAGLITGVTFTTLGTVAADNTDYVGINVYKANGAGGTHVLVASYDSRAANQGAIAAGVPVNFALSAVAGALDLLSTDVLSYEVTKGGSGKVVPVGSLSVIGKVI